MGVVGLGSHAQRSHIEPLGVLPGVEIVAVCDPDEGARRRFVDGGSHPAAAAYRSSEDLLEHDGLDAVIVASPDRFHLETLTACVQAGVHALVEKPLADRRAQLPQLASALMRAAEQGLIISSCHPRRFDPPYVALRRELPWLQQRLGALLEIRCDFLYRLPRKADLHTGLLMDHINHELDLVHFLVGHSPFVAHRLIDGQDRYAASGVRQDGIVFSFSGTRRLQRTAYPEYVHLRFDGGTATLLCDAGTLEWTDIDQRADPFYGATRVGATDYAARFSAVNENFVRACQGQEASYLGHRDLVLNTEIGIALTEDGTFDSVRSLLAA